MRKNSCICHVAAALHNYVLNETDPNEMAEDFITVHWAAPDNLGYNPTIIQMLRLMQLVMYHRFVELRLFAS